MPMSAGLQLPPQPSPGYCRLATFSPTASIEGHQPPQCPPESPPLPQRMWVVPGRRMTPACANRQATCDSFRLRTNLSQQYWAHARDTERAGGRTKDVRGRSVEYIYQPCCCRPDRSGSCHPENGCRRAVVLPAVQDVHEQARIREQSPFVPAGGAERRAVEPCVERHDC
eukprot:7386515-Prymnesium_polylepis.1